MTAPTAAAAVGKRAGNATGGRGRPTRPAAPSPVRERQHSPGTGNSSSSAGSAMAAGGGRPPPRPMHSGGGGLPEVNRGPATGNGHRERRSARRRSQPPGGGPACGLAVGWGWQRPLAAGGRLRFPPRHFEVPLSRWWVGRASPRTGGTDRPRHGGWGLTGAERREESPPVEAP